MKNKIRVILLVVSLLVLSLMPSFGNAASDYLDEIENYTVTINVRQDGTLDMRYDIEWKVLSDKNGKEPVNWVTVGIPNKHVDQIQALTDNIKTIGYSNSGGGDFVRVDFVQDYYQDAIFHFSFAIHQSYMYMLDEEGICRYGFTPGWFEKIEVKELHILWNNENVVSSDATHKSENYLEWYKTDMAAGEHFSVNVRYHISTFDVDEKMQYSEKKSSSTGEIIAIVLLVVVIILFILIVIDDYSGGSGFGGGGTRVYYHSSCARSSCACAHSCACACACAGGGRAGCSVKDFYKIDALEKICAPWYVRLFRKVLKR
ncbi:MAG: hypothetical protein IJ867_07720 [Clostridia bacterium]|nr:hypothetical protein [Clostridia bacterium]